MLTGRLQYVVRRLHHLARASETIRSCRRRRSRRQDRAGLHRLHSGHCRPRHGEVDLQHTRRLKGGFGITVKIVTITARYRHDNGFWAGIVPRSAMQWW